MEYTFKKWKINDIYNFNIEFNRIDSYNKYCSNWLSSYYSLTLPIQTKIDWTINDIIDINDYNNLKGNLNGCLSIINSIYKISPSNQLSKSIDSNQVFDYYKANEMENILKEYLTKLGNLQFYYNVSGLTTSGNNIKLIGVI